jgi:hypothetical protein
VTAKTVDRSIFYKIIFRVVLTDKTVDKNQKVSSTVNAQWLMARNPLQNGVHNPQVKWPSVKLRRINTYGFWLLVTNFVHRYKSNFVYDHLCLWSLHDGRAGTMRFAPAAWQGEKHVWNRRVHRRWDEDHHHYILICLHPKFYHSCIHFDSFDKLYWHVFKGVIIDNRCANYVGIELINKHMLHIKIYYW